MNFYLKLLDENFGQIIQHSNDEYYKNLVLFYVALMLFLTLFFFLCSRERHNVLQLPLFFMSFFFLFCCKLYLGLQNCKSVFLILKISQYVESRQ